MAFDDAVERALQLRHIDWSVETYGERNGVRGIADPALEGKSALCRRERNAFGALRPLCCRAAGGASGRRFGSVAVVCEEGREVDESRVGEDLGNTDHASGCQAQPGQHTRGRQRMATEVEEVVVDARPCGVRGVEAEDVGNGVDNEPLEVGARLTSRGSARRGRSGKRPAVGLATRCARQRVESCPRGRDHRCGQRSDECGRDGVGGLSSGNVDVQTSVSVMILAGHRHSVVDAVECEDGLFHLTEFDAGAADLHLRVGSTEQLQATVRSDQTTIAGAIHPIAGPYRVGDESRCRPVGMAVVAPCELDAGDVHLAGTANRHRMQVAVEYDDTSARDLCADGDRADRGSDISGGGIARGAGNLARVDADRRGRDVSRNLRRPVRVHHFICGAG